MSTATEISLNLMPAFYTKHLGLRYGQAYYFDPSYRERIEREEYRLLHELLAEYDAFPEPFRPSANLFIQPLDLIRKTQGSEWRFSDDATVESVGAPWAKLSIDEIRRIDPQAAAQHPILRDLVAQYRQMQRQYGERADIFGMKSGVMNIHTPYTTAQQLYGENLFILLLSEPESATVIFEKVWEIYQAIIAALQTVTGAPLTRIQMGDCAASLISAETYRTVVAPMNRKIAAGFHWVGYHSCGPSTHLLEAFRTLAPLDSIELGPGTDLNQASRLMPRATMCPLVDPGVMRNGSPEAVEQTVAQILRDTRLSAQTILCAWSFDRETPFDNLRALYGAVRKT